MFTIWTLNEAMVEALGSMPIDSQSIEWIVYFENLNSVGVRIDIVCDGTAAAVVWCISISVSINGIIYCWANWINVTWTDVKQWNCMKLIYQKML